MGIVQGLVSDARSEGLWFLKHSTMDRNEGVHCFRGSSLEEAGPMPGVKQLLARWEKMPRSERLLYVAQARK